MKLNIQVKDEREIGMVMVWGRGKIRFIGVKNFLKLKKGEKTKSPFYGMDFVRFCFFPFFD